jgi:hypothetical protein
MMMIDDELLSMIISKMTTTDKKNYKKQMSCQPACLF